MSPSQDDGIEDLTKKIHLLPDENVPENAVKNKPLGNEKLRRDVKWPNVLFYIYLHLAAIYGLLLVLREAQWKTVFLAVGMCGVLPLGVTMGAHRLYAHRSFRASATVRGFLVFLHTLVGQGPLYDWVLQHRLHHKVHDTLLDPFDSRRGFLFAHINSKLAEKNPQMVEVERSIDMSDLENDSFVMMQKRLYWLVMPVFSFLLPVNAPVEYWGESLLTSLCVVGFLRHAIVLNIAWLVHSAPIIWSLRKDERFCDSNMVFFISKTRWPNYHYLIPWDYRTGEFGDYGQDWTTKIIQLLHKWGWVSELHTCTDDMIKQALETAIDQNLSLVEGIDKVRVGMETSRTNGNVTNYAKEE